MPLMVSFATQKFVLLMRSSVSISFVTYVFGAMSKKYSLSPRSPRFAPMSSVRMLIVLALSLRSTVHLELFFVSGVRKRLKFIMWISI
jgi:hypothetical protein